MPDRTPLLAANWKMNVPLGGVDGYLDVFLPRVEGSSAEIVLCPPFTMLEATENRCRGTAVQVAAQNMHDELEGAFTGEISALMLEPLGIRRVLLGHSERRQYFAENDSALARKVPLALETGLLPILCVGENESQRDADETEGVLTRQIEADLANVPDDRLGEVVIAYEPVWAIGTGRTATPEQAQEAIALIRGLVESRTAEAAAAIRILYGGSVKPDNVAELVSQADVDGALVGGACLDAEDFASIVDAAR